MRECLETCSAPERQPTVAWATCVAPDYVQGLGSRPRLQYIRASLAESAACLHLRKNLLSLTSTPKPHRNLATMPSESVGLKQLRAGGGRRLSP